MVIAFLLCAALLCLRRRRRRRLGGLQLGADSLPQFTMWCFYAAFEPVSQLLHLAPLPIRARLHELLLHWNNLWHWHPASVVLASADFACRVGLAIKADRLIVQLVPGLAKAILR